MHTDCVSISEAANMGITITRLCSDSQAEAEIKRYKDFSPGQDAQLPSLSS